MAAGTRGLSEPKSTFVRSTSGVGFDDDGLNVSAEAPGLEVPFLTGAEGAGEATGATGIGMTSGICFNFSRSIWLMLMSSFAEVSNRIREISCNEKLSQDHLSLL